MGFDRIIPLGSWCRNAFQINRFKQEHNVKAISYPFDWTITPVRSLEKVFLDTFKKSNVLQEHQYKKTAKNHKQSEWLQDPYSEIFFVEWHSPSVRQSRERFLHTFNHLENLKGQENLIFMRWFSETKYNLRQRGSYENDDTSNYKTLHENIKKFIGTDKFKIIEVYSKHNEEKQLIHKETDEKFVFRFEINEPDLEIKNGFRGCNDCWNQLLGIIGERYGLS